MPDGVSEAEAVSQWLWWGGYLGLAAVGWVVAFRRSWRLGLLRRLAPRLPSWLLRPVQLLQFMLPGRS